MIEWMVESIDEFSRFLGRFAGPPADSSADSSHGTLTPQERERIRQSLWRLKRDLQDLSAPNLIQDISGLLDGTFGGAGGFVRWVRSWTDLIDNLVFEAERDLGTAPGRGPYKRRGVKGALLYLVSRSDLDIPRLPAFLAPLAWDVILDPAIDFVVHLANRNSLWGSMPRSPDFRGRIRVAAHRMSGVVETSAHGLTRLVWRVVFIFTPAPPRLKAAVDRFIREDPRPAETMAVLAEWVIRHSGTLVVLSDLVSVAVVEAHFFIEADENRRKAYAREFLLDFIDDEIGLPDRESLSFLLVQFLIDAGIDLVTMLLEKHHYAGAGGNPDSNLDGR